MNKAWKITLVAILLTIVWWLFQSDESVQVVPTKPFVTGTTPKTQTPSQPVSNIERQPFSTTTPSKGATSQDLSTPLPQSPQVASVQENAIAPITGIVVDRDGQPVAGCRVMGIPVSDIRDPSLQDCMEIPGILLGHSDDQGCFLLSPPSEAEAFLVGIPPISRKP
ncbi:MAG: hypothetical protein AB7F75_12130 [Planctomycetota bacterium]